MIYHYVLLKFLSHNLGSLSSFHYGYRWFVLYKYQVAFIKHKLQVVSFP